MTTRDFDNGGHSTSSTLAGNTATTKQPARQGTNKRAQQTQFQRRRAGQPNPNMQNCWQHCATVHSSTARQQIPSIWCNLCSYRLHKSLTILLPILSYINPVHALPTYFFKININIILSSMRRYSKSCLSFRFTQQNPACTFPPHDRITVITLVLKREACKHLMPSPYTTSALSQLTRLQRRQQNRPLRFRVHITFIGEIFGPVRKLAFIT